MLKYSLVIIFAFMAYFLFLGSNNIALAQSQVMQYQNDWTDIRINVADVEIFVSYQVKIAPQGMYYPYQGYVYAVNRGYVTDNMWVNVKRANLSESDTVRVMLISYVRNTYKSFGGVHQNIQTMDLEFAEPGRFTAQFPPMPLGGNPGPYSISKVEKYEVVLWINSYLYKSEDGTNITFDPVSYRHSCTSRFM